MKTHCSEACLLDIYLEAWLNIKTAKIHARLGKFASAALNFRMAAEKLQAIHDSRESQQIPTE